MEPWRPKYWDDEKEAWDRYASAALQVTLPALVPHCEGDLERRVKNAALIADAMLEERRRRVETKE